MNSEKQNLKTRGILMAAAAGVVYGVASLVSKKCLSFGDSTSTVTLCRNLMSLVLLYAINKSAKNSLKISFRQALVFSVAGLFFNCITPLLLYGAYGYISVGLAVCLHNIYPVVIIVLNLLIYRQNPGKMRIAAVAIACAGVWITTFSASSMNLKGVGMALASAVTYSIYMMMLGTKELKGLPGPVCAFYCGAFASFWLIVFGIVKGEELFSVHVGALPWILLAAVLVMCLGNSLVASAVKQIGTTTVGLLGILEPFTSTVLGMLLLHEVVTARSVAGSVLVLMGAALAIISSGRDGKAEKKASEPAAVQSAAAEIPEVLNSAAPECPAAGTPESPDPDMSGNVQ